MAEAMEISLLSFISICAGEEWNLSNSEVATITSCVFIGMLFGNMFWGPFAGDISVYRFLFYFILFLTHFVCNRHLREAWCISFRLPN